MSNWEEYTQQKATIAATIRAAAADGSQSNQFATRTLDNAPFWSIFGLDLAQMKQRLRVCACGAAIMALTCPDVSPQSVGANG